MKKRILSATLAAVCAISSLSLAAFADGSGEVTQATAAADVTANTANGAAATDIEAITSVPDFKVSLPAKIDYIVNPYQLKVKIGSKLTQDTILSPDIVIKNSGNGKIAVKATFTDVTVASGSNIIIVDGINKPSGDGAKAYTVDTKSATDKTVQLFLEPATAKVDSKTKETVYSYSNKYNNKTCELLYSAAGTESAIDTVKLVQPGTNTLLTLGPQTTEDGEAITATLNATLKSTDFIDGYDADKTYYVAKNHTNAEITELYSSYVTAIDGLIGDALDAKKAKMKEDLAKLITTSENDAAKEVIYKDTEGHIKVSGSVNTSVQWAASDTVGFKIAWKLERLVNDIDRNLNA